MTRSIIAVAALLAGFVVAAPTVVWSADNPTSSTTATPPQSGMPGMRGMPGMMGGMAGAEHPGWMHQRMMRRMMQMTPEQRCNERLARRAGMIAYTKAKLNLTAEQRPAWDKLNAQLQAAADKQRQLCASLKPAGERGKQTILERVSRREQFLTARLDGLHQIRPALEQFYQVLTPEQKAIIDHPFRHP